MVDFLVPLDNDWGNVDYQQYPCLPSRVPSGAAAKRRKRQKKASGAPSKEPTHTEVSDQQAKPVSKKRKHREITSTGEDTAATPAEQDSTLRSQVEQLEQSAQPGKKHGGQPRNSKFSARTEDATPAAGQQETTGDQKLSPRRNETAEPHPESAILPGQGRRKRNKNKFKQSAKEDIALPGSLELGINQAEARSDEPRRSAKRAKPNVLAPSETTTGNTIDAGQPSRHPERSFLEKLGGSKLTNRLLGSKFRWLNEKLYTTTGDGAFELMADQPDLFEQYHKGFEEQTKGWSNQPVDLAIKWLKKQHQGLKVADFGCGNAQLAKTVPQHVDSLDLVASAPEVIACNMSKTPLESDSKDVVIFCLALMGVDYPSFVMEGRRVLKTGGRIWIAEVRSRFAQTGDAREDVRPFITAMEGIGMKLVSSSSSKIFIVFVFKLVSKATVSDTLEWPTLKPCLYKRR